MKSLQTRIFVLPQEPHEDFVETVVGRVIAPLAVEFSDTLEWFWFSLYTIFIGSPGEDCGDCNYAAIPASYKAGFGGNPALHRSIRFRFGLKDDACDVFTQRLAELLAANAYAHSGVIDYDMLNDTGSDRFLAVESMGAGRPQRRSGLIVGFYHALAKLFVDALVGPDGQNRFRLEQNNHGMNPNNSTFESLHHMFCNMTEPPLEVLFDVSVGTRQYPPTPQLVALRVRF